MPSSGEVVWYYHAVKQETASSIFYGFSTLFPSLLDRVQVMNRLLESTTGEQGDRSPPTKKLLVPMLIPSFTSAKMLFLLMSESGSFFEKGGESARESAVIIAKFLDTLLDTLGKQTLDILGDLEGTGENASVAKALESLQISDEFKCLNVFLRAAIYWCSQYPRDGWQVVEPACSKLVQFTLRLMQRASSLPPSRVAVLPCVVRHTFAGALLPFTLLSALSLPEIRELLPSVIDGFWSQLEQLTSTIHEALKTLVEDQTAGQTVVSCSEKPGCHIQDVVQFDLSQTPLMSAELAACLTLPAESSATYGDILKSIWEKASGSSNSKTTKVKDGRRDTKSLYRISLPPDLVKLFGSETLLVECSGDLDLLETRGTAFDPTKVSFVPSRTILSQQIYPPKRDELIVPHSATSSEAQGESLLALSKSFGFSNLTLSESSVWLQDLQKTLVWVGSHYAASLIAGSEYQPAGTIDPRWAVSPLFSGGLASGVDATSSGSGRNELLLQQIVDNSGHGKKLIDKVRNALDPAAGVGGNNLHLKATRLKRQDSVDAAIEKSGGYEIVDRAVRCAFAALLKHSNVFYTAEPLSVDGVPSETVVDAWRSALQLRRWYVATGCEMEKRQHTCCIVTDASPLLKPQDRPRAAEARSAFQVSAVLLLVEVQVAARIN